MSDNREIYNTRYTADNVRLAPDTAYDKHLIALRFGLIEEFGAGRDVLDLCCGTGSFLIPVLLRLRSAVGLDFSRNMLDGLRAELGGGMPDNLRLVEADAASLPLRDAIFDFVYSYTSLYNVPQVEAALAEVGRVLRPGGHAALELGNRNSLADRITRGFHEQDGWAVPYTIPYKDMAPMLAGAGLRIVRRHAFQVLPMYGAPRRMQWLRPLATPRWKSVMGLRVGGRMLDQWICGAAPFRGFAFRHLFVVRKS